MFTGIIEAVGTVDAVEVSGSAARLTLSSPEFAGALANGESVAVDGVCLTVAAVDGPRWEADVMRITREVTTLGGAASGGKVNLERAVRADARLGGHIVQGHVDGVATLVKRETGAEWDDLTFRLPPGLARYVVSKGSIAINGTSLTAATLDGDLVTVSLIPTTLTHTTFGAARVGDHANIEVDILAKYVEGLLGARA